MNKNKEIQIEQVQQVPVLANYVRRKMKQDMELNSRIEKGAQK